MEGPLRSDPQKKKTHGFRRSQEGISPRINDNDNDTLREVRPTIVRGMTPRKKSVRTDAACSVGKVCTYTVDDSVQYIEHKRNTKG